MLGQPATRGGMWTGSGRCSAVTAGAATVCLPPSASGRPPGPGPGQLPHAVPAPSSSSQLFTPLLNPSPDRHPADLNREPHSWGDSSRGPSGRWARRRARARARARRRARPRRSRRQVRAADVSLQPAAASFPEGLAAACMTLAGPLNKHRDSKATLVSPRPPQHQLHAHSSAPPHASP